MMIFKVYNGARYWGALMVYENGHHVCACNKKIVSCKLIKLLAHPQLERTK